MLTKLRELKAAGPGGLNTLDFVAANPAGIDALVDCSPHCGAWNCRKSISPTIRQDACIPRVNTSAATRRQTVAWQAMYHYT